MEKQPIYKVILVGGLVYMNYSITEVYYPVKKISFKD